MQELIRQRALLSPDPAGGNLPKENPGGQSSAAYPTQVSNTTPDKAVEKSRIEISKEVSTASLAYGDTIPGNISPCGSPLAPRSLDLGQTGESPDEIMVLREQYMKAMARNADLEVQVKVLQDQLAQVNMHAPERMNVIPELDQNDGTGGQPIPDVAFPASDEAARKRLQRICTPKADGKHVNVVYFFWVCFENGMLQTYFTQHISYNMNHIFDIVEV